MALKNCQSAYKPGLVWRWGSSRVMAIPLGRPLPTVSSNLPGRRARDGPRGLLRDRLRPYSVLLPVGLAGRRPLPAGAVRSYRTVSPLPAVEPAGGLVSVALSLGLPPPDVIRHRVSMEPELPPPPKAAAIQPTGEPDRRVTLCRQPTRNILARGDPTAIPTKSYGISWHH